MIVQGRTSPSSTTSPSRAARHRPGPRFRRKWVIAGVAALVLSSILIAAPLAAQGRDHGPSLAAAHGADGPPASLPANAKAVKVPILMYHYVDATAPRVGPHAGDLTVRTRDFLAQMDFLAKHGYHAVTLEQVYAAMVGGGSLPTKPVALTFDDGGLDDYTVAYPILRSHDFVATFFVISGSVGGPTAMTWDQLREMQAAGMAIESHTAHHGDLVASSAAALSAELNESRKTIEAELGRAPLVVSYPFGRYDDRVIDAARDAGYLIAVTTHQGRVLTPDSVYCWPRVHVAAMESLKGFEAGLGVPVTL